MVSEGVAVAFLFALSELLESFSMARARQAIQSLLSLSSETALLKNGDMLEEVPLERVRVSDIIAVNSGARVPLDGAVVSGASSVDQGANHRRINTGREKARGPGFRRGNQR